MFTGCLPSYLPRASTPAPGTAVLLSTVDAPCSGPHPARFPSLPRGPMCHCLFVIWREARIAGCRHGQSCLAVSVSVCLSVPQGPGALCPPVGPDSSR